MKGVHLTKSGSWLAKITINGEIKTKTFKSEFEAIEQRLAWEKEAINNRNPRVFNDITGKRFGRLVVTGVSRETKYGKRLWHCQCDCGSQSDIPRFMLVDGSVKSCGCLQKETQLKNIAVAQNKVRIEDSRDGTRKSMLTAKTSKSNTSGHKGVSWDKKQKKYVSYIYFKRKKIYLGIFDTLEAAVVARKKAEEKYFKPILEK